MSTDSSDCAGYFARDSMIWRVNREMALLLVGGRALLMQLAHPKVAAGVAEHSRFQEDPFRRLHRTMSAMWSIVFDAQGQARAALDGVTKVHGRVHGVVPADEGTWGGAPYDALDQELLLWVHATLIDSALVAYDLFVTPMAEAEREAYYNDSKKLASLFGIADEHILNSLGDFNAYVARMIASSAIAAGPAARSLAHDVLYPRQWIFKPGGPLFRFVTAGLLPEKLRTGYGLKWSARREKTLAQVARVIRTTLPLVPAPLRIVPNARAAEKAHRR
ncbi:MAG TPA: oxygenase MpaB family protein [Terriglobales bacterium]|nr:oxygenase MpaB family protein [Terriglobales bacterium]